MADVMLLEDASGHDTRAWTVSLFPVRDGTTEITGLGVVVVDVTRRRRAEEALLASREQLTLAFEAANLGLWDWNLVTGEQSWSDRQAALFGLTREEYAGTMGGFLSLVHPEDRPEVEALVPHVLASGRYDHEFRVLWPDGRVRWLRGLAHVHRDASGTPVRMIGVNYDVTERKAAERVLREAHAHLEAKVRDRTRALDEALVRAEVLAQLGDALHGARTPADVASLALAHLGPAVEATGMLVASLTQGQPTVTTTWGDVPASPATPGEDGPPDAVGAWPVDVPRSGDAHYDDGDASCATRLASAVEPVRTTQGVLVGFLVAWRPSGRGAWRDGQRDVLRRGAATLGLALERAEADLTLRRVNRSLRRSNMELERFAYITSHDLVEPIRTVASFAGLLERHLDGQLDARGREFLRHLQQGTLRMRSLVDDVLTYSRVGGEGLRWTAVPLGAPLAEAVARLRCQIEERDARVTWDPMPTVTADAPSLAQVFQNLVSNAVKFVPPGVTPEVHVTARRVDGAWQVTVRDNGIGIEAAYHERIFELFQRLHPRDRFDGTGLGLSICQKIVERHGGRMWVDSTPGAGSVFHFVLPDRPEPLT